MRRPFLGTLSVMVWVVLVLVAVSWLVVSLILEQERGESVPVHSRIAARLRQLPGELRRFRSSRRPQTLRFRAEPVTRRHVDAGRALPSDGWRSRLVALIELILFLVLISALFAGAIAAAALRIGHLGT
jgi:hypothetical protein